MTNREYIEKLNTEDLCDYLLFQITWEDATEAFSERYCNKCEPLKTKLEAADREVEICWCEWNDEKCKYFDRKVTDKDYIRAWLEKDRVEKTE